MHDWGRLTFNHYEHLLRRMAAAPFGDWSEASVAAACAAEGWALERPLDDCVVTVKTPAPLLGAALAHARRPRGHFSSLELTIGERRIDPRRFWRYAQLTSDHLGFEPHLFGGNGPAGGTFLWWRQPDIGPRLGISHVLVLRGDRLTLRLCPTEFYEADWQGCADYASDENVWDDRFPTWLRRRPDERLTGMLMPGGPAVTTWHGFEQTLARTLYALGASLPVFGDSISVRLGAASADEPYGRFVIDTDGDLIVSASVGAGEPCLGDDEMRALGWVGTIPSIPQEWVFGGRADDPAFVRAAASKLVTTLIRLGVTLPGDRHDGGIGYWAEYGFADPARATGSRVELWGLGVPARGF